MAIKNFKTKEEALAAMKKATDRKRTLIEYLKKGYSLEELEKMGFAQYEISNFAQPGRE